MAAAPWTGSPPMALSAELAPELDVQAASVRAARRSASRELVGTGAPENHLFAFAEPAREQGKAGGDVDESGRHPHDEPAELLVFKRSESPGCGCRGIRRIPDGGRESEQRAEDGGVDGGGEYIKDRRAGAVAARLK